MGSFLGQSFVADHSEALAGVVYSGSNGAPPAIATAGRLIARAERLRLGKRGKSRLLYKMLFGDFNRPFRAGAHRFRLAFARPGRGRRLCRRSALRLSLHDAARDRPSRRSARSPRRGEARPHPQGSAGLRLLRRARPRRRQCERPDRGAERGQHDERHGPHLSRRPARNAERNEPGRGHAGLDRLARRRGRGSAQIKRRTNSLRTANEQRFFAGRNAWTRIFPRKCWGNPGPAEKLAANWNSELIRPLSEFLRRNSEFEARAVFSRFRVRRNASLA